MFVKNEETIGSHIIVNISMTNGCESIFETPMVNQLDSTTLTSTFNSNTPQLIGSSISISNSISKPHHHIKMQFQYRMMVSISKPHIDALDFEAKISRCCYVKPAAD